jgi:hypothetical protein
MMCPNCGWPYAFQAVMNEDGVEADKNSDRVYCGNCKGWTDFDTNALRVG